MSEFFEKNKPPPKAALMIDGGAANDAGQPAPKLHCVTKLSDVPTDSQVNPLHDIRGVIGRSEPRGSVAEQSEIITTVKFTPTLVASSAHLPRKSRNMNFDVLNRTFAGHET